MPTFRDRFLGSPIPKYRCHRASGQAVVTLSGKDFYLGPHGTRASRLEFDRLIGEWMAAGRQLPPSYLEAGELTVAELMVRYLRFVRGYYLVDGKPGREQQHIKTALQPVRHVYGKVPVAEFGPLALKAIRQLWIDAGLARRHINQRVGRLKRMFKWGVAEELVPASVCQSLQAVDGLRFGHTAARETEPVKPVPDAWVEAVLPCVAPTVAAMIQLQRLTGMRAGEVCMMRGVDIDMTGPVWIYKPATHKSAWRGKQRSIPLGPRAQEIIRQYLRPAVQEYLFQPRQARAERYQQLRAERKSKVQPSQVDRSKKRPQRAPGDRYDTRAYNRAIAYGITKAGCPHWHSHQLRHTAASEIRRQFGLEAVQGVLGHANMNVSEIYAEKNLDLAAEIMRKIG